MNCAKSQDAHFHFDMYVNYVCGRFHNGKLNFLLVKQCSARGENRPKKTRDSQKCGMLHLRARLRIPGRGFRRHSLTLSQGERGQFSGGCRAGRGFLWVGRWSVKFCRKKNMIRYSLSNIMLVGVSISRNVLAFNHHFLTCP